MTVDLVDWESRLLSLAKPEPVQQIKHDIKIDHKILKQAYRLCEQIISVHSRTFYTASSLLPSPKRVASRVLYAFCRIVDDTVDRPGISPRTELAALKHKYFSHPPTHADPVSLAWSDIRHRYQIPEKYSYQLIHGVATDLEKTRYQTFGELAEYAYGVASTVGLMSMHIIGFSGEEAIPYAVKLGLALQITNILRDVGEDAAMGRIYLPQEELAAFGITEEEIHAGVVSERWREFMRFQIERNRELYRQAWAGIAMLHADGQFSIAAAARLYAAILDDIEAHNYDVFSRRAHVSGWKKAVMLPSIWKDLKKREFTP